MDLLEFTPFLEFDGFDFNSFIPDVLPSTEEQKETRYANLFTTETLSLSEDEDQERSSCESNNGTASPCLLPCLSLDYPETLPQVEKENQVPSFVAENEKLLRHILEGLNSVNARVSAIEQRVGEIANMQCLLAKLIAAGNGEREIASAKPATNGISSEMRSFIGSTTPLKYWGECLHTALWRPDLFSTIIHWDTASNNYWVSNEDSLYSILAALKGSTSQRARESMKSRFFVKLVNDDASRKEVSKELVFDLYENKKKDYTPQSLHYPRVGQAQVERTPRIKTERKHFFSDSEDETPARKKRNM
jgi:hypothetical protein